MKLDQETTFLVDGKEVLVPDVIDTYAWRSGVTIGDFYEHHQLGRQVIIDKTWSFLSGRLLIVLSLGRPPANAARGSTVPGHSGETRVLKLDWAKRTSSIPEIPYDEVLAINACAGETIEDTTRTKFTILCRGWFYQVVGAETHYTSVLTVAQVP